MTRASLVAISFVCVPACLAQAEAPVFHSFSEPLLSFFPAAITRFEHEGISTDSLVLLIRNAQATVDDVNQRANDFIRTNLAGDIARNEALLAYYNAAAKEVAEAELHASQVAAEAPRVARQQSTYGPLPKTQAEKMAEQQVANAREKMTYTSAVLSQSRRELNEKLASKIQPAENSAYETVTASAQRFTEFSKAQGIKSIVRVKTQEPGAIAHFQTIGQRLQSDPGITANQITNDGQIFLPIGIYYVWTVRGKRVTSDINRQVMVVDERVPIDVAEN